jgi:putative YphP/YqiW family bacilliredoxin
MTLTFYGALKNMPYNPALVAPMREEMTRMGAIELTTSTQVDAALGDQRGTMLVFVNSVCGCAAGNARPALRLALEHPVKPQQVVTVFAGQDLDATSRARQYFSEYQPSSPSIALVRDGEVVHFIHRHQIEGQSPQSVAANLTAAFDRYCGATV